MTYPHLNTPLTPTIIAQAFGETFGETFAERTAQSDANCLIDEDEGYTRERDFRCTARTLGEMMEYLAAAWRRQDPMAKPFLDKLCDKLSIPHIPDDILQGIEPDLEQEIMERMTVRDNFAKYKYDKNGNLADEGYFADQLIKIYKAAQAHGEFDICDEIAKEFDRRAEVYRELAKQIRQKRETHTPSPLTTIIDDAREPKIERA